MTRAQVKLFDIVEARELASLISLPGNDWLVATPDGLFDGTPATWGQVSWRLTPRLLEAMPVEAFFGDYFYPNLLGEVLLGKRPAAPAALRQKDRRQPQVQLTLPEVDASKSLTERTAKVRVTVTSAPAGARDVRLFRNDALVKRRSPRTPSSSIFPATARRRATNASTSSRTTSVTRTLVARSTRRGLSRYSRTAFRTRN